METQQALKKPGRPKKKQPMLFPLNQITAHLPSDLVLALDQELVPLGMWSRSELIREACQAYLDLHKEEKAEMLSLTRRMQEFSREERRKIMATAAESLAGYYRTDAEMRGWQALDTQDFYDVDE